MLDIGGTPWPAAARGYLTSREGLYPQSQKRQDLPGTYHNPRQAREEAGCVGWRLFRGVDAGGCRRAVLLSSAAANSDRADDLAAHYDGYPTFGGHGLHGK